MQTIKGLADFVAALESVDVPYMLVGSLAGNLYSEPRSTADADFIAEFAADKLRGFLRALPQDVDVDLQTSFELRTVTTRRLQATLPTKFKVEVFDVGDDPHHVERFARRVRKKLASLEVDAWVATGEDMLIQKLRWGRPKDVEDAVGYVAVSGDSFDWDYIHRWTDEHGTTAALEEVRKTVAELMGE